MFFINAHSPINRPLLTSDLITNRLCVLFTVHRIMLRLLSMVITHGSLIHCVHLALNLLLLMSLQYNNLNKDYFSSKTSYHALSTPINFSNNKSV